MKSGNWPGNYKQMTTGKSYRKFRNKCNDKTKKDRSEYFSKQYKDLDVEQGHKRYI